MAKIPMSDPLSTEARSPLIAGLSEAVNKLSGVLDLKTATLTDFPLVEVYISDEDRGRMYQAPLGNKLWLDTPAPVFKKNGTVITPITDNFTIDYVGGSVVFERGYNLLTTDVLTVDATYVVDSSKALEEIEPERITEDQIDAMMSEST